MDCRTVEQERRILDHVAPNPGTNTRGISSAKGVHRSTVWRILHEDRLYPYHLRRLQGLKPKDLPRRIKILPMVFGTMRPAPAFSVEAMVHRRGNVYTGWNF